MLAKIAYKYIMMKKTFFLIVLLFGFIKVEAQNNRELNPAAIEILERIIFIENQFKEYKNGAVVRFNFAPGIVELSGIIPKYVNGDYNGIYYIPNETEISLWKEWFELNKANFSYANNEYSNIIYELDNQKMIQIEYEKGKYRYEISKDQLEYIKEDYLKIIKHGR